MIQNVIDNRKRQHRWKCINVVIEPTWHDNSVVDSDRAEPAANESDYEERNRVSVAEAIAWAHALPFPVTVHLYDDGESPGSHS